MRDKYDVIIIGSGMGGLSSGAWLAHKGRFIVEWPLDAAGNRSFCNSHFWT